MKFGVREICDVVFKANQNGKLGGIEVKKGQPVLYIDSAKTSTIEGAATAVYATGGRGNTKLVTWEGEKTLTFTVEDALLSDVGFAILSGAGLFNLATEDAMVHCTAVAYVDSDAKIALEDKVAADAPIFVMGYSNGSIDPTTIIPVVIDSTDATGKTLKTTTTYASKQVFVDYYKKSTTAVTEIQIDAENFAGYYYVEASTLFRRESDGKDLPAEITFPKVKIQSNFTFTMASSGDPSTFTFTMDAMPAYTMFERTKKVLCAIQVIDDYVSEAARVPVTNHDSDAIDQEVMNVDSQVSTLPTQGGGSGN
jgi:hypothetical protein